MSLNSKKNTTKSSWDTIPMPDTIIDHINELYYNAPNMFIFTDCRGCSIGDFEITGVDSDAGDSNEKKSQQDPPHELQATKYTEEETAIPDPKINFYIKQKTPIEQVQAPNEPPKYLITVAVQPQMTETNITQHTRSGGRSYSRVRT